MYWEWSIKLGDNIQLGWLLYIKSSHVFPSEIDCNFARAINFKRKGKKNQVKTWFQRILYWKSVFAISITIWLIQIGPFINSYSGIGVRAICKYGSTRQNIFSSPIGRIIAMITNFIFRRIEFVWISGLKLKGEG